MKNGLSLHIGLITFIVGLIAVFYFSIFDLAIFPNNFLAMFFDPTKTMVVWLYLLLDIFISLAPIALVAGILDRCPRWHAVVAILLIMSLGSLVWNGGTPFQSTLAGFAEGFCVLLVYLAGRRLRTLANSLARRRTPQLVS